MTLPLAFSTNAFKKNTLDEAIDAIAHAGYGGIELMADLHHAYPERFIGWRRRDAMKRIGDLGMSVSNINAFTHFVDGDTYHPSWIESDRKLVQKRIDHTNRCLEMAAEFGARTVSVQPGGPMIASELLRENALDEFAANLLKCLETARSSGVILAVEPEPGLLIENASEYVEFKRRYFPGESMVQMNCDVGHLFCVGDNPAAVIRALPSEIAHVHLEDIGANRVHQHLTPGKGVIRFGEIFDALRDVHYGGIMTVELYPYETTAAGVAEAAFAHLSPILYGV